MAKMITINTSGNFDNTKRFFGKLSKVNVDAILSHFGALGVEALERATPKRTGRTSRSWDYKIERKNGTIRLVWYNNNIQNGSNIAILIQYGFVTKTGYRVAGRDYINPALQPIYDEIIKTSWEEVL